MNLKFEKAENRKYGYVVFLDNVEIGEADDNWGGLGSEFSISFTDTIFEISNQYKISDFFKENIGAFTIPINFEKFQNLNWANNYQTSLWLQEKNEILLSVMPDFVKWNKPYDIVNFIKKLSSVLIPYGFLVDFKDDNFLNEGFYISSNFSLDKNIYEEYERFLSIINIEVKNIFENPNLIDVDSIINKFSFPQETRQACEQYLIYFSKFLEDYGIEITSILESKNEDTFFSIKPKNSKEALSNIRDLLSFYLSLPDIQNLEITVKDYNDVSVQQLMSNIYHLKSQLFLAHSIVESKNATIESLKFSNFQKQIYIEQNLKNEEKTLDGLVTIQEFEYGSFKFDLPEIFRRLKRRFTK
ncbi:hypothetical protein LNP04_17940 [Chryseobacterium sp. C-71]|uniref:hypothetical protein n=1 Tax=Chryseobacterium sp. C-71 TaxID=2893882 RepID=UPI001E4D552D|nr:hypothetical protein [Chryseobacterium sp. C-71]UFH31824.1 hypothetical protein LNP04_17940 [Chryseobacterium sp. C-71]